jgi:hypothetical protein
MSELESLPEKVVSVVPYFFYDLFGRILPGLFFLCGVFLAWRHGSRVQWFLEQAQRARAAEWVVGGVILVAGCFLSGFLLSTVSQVLWVPRIPVSLATLRDHFGSPATEESSIETAFRAHFGFRLDHSSKEKTYLVYCSRLCQLAVASLHPALDSQSRRVESEELLSRSLCAASIILLLVSAARGQWTACIAYVVIALLSFLSYRHYRAKGFREKFQMFLVLFRTEGSSKDAGHAGADR